MNFYVPRFCAFSGYKFCHSFADYINALYTRTLHVFTLPIFYRVFQVDLHNTLSVDGFQMQMAQTKHCHRREVRTTKKRLYVRVRSTNTRFTAGQQTLCYETSDFFFFCEKICTKALKEGLALNIPYAQHKDDSGFG